MNVKRTKKKNELTLTQLIINNLYTCEQNQ